MSSILDLSDQDRLEIDKIISAGKHQAKVIKRAIALLSFSKGIKDAQIEEVLGMSRSTLWRTRVAYIEVGLHSALYDNTRSGRPKKYELEQELQLKAWIDKG
jgi:transposase